MSKFTPEKRRELAKQGLAMPDGGYPIRNRSDLVKAIQAYGRGTNKPEIKRWIKKRAKELNAEKYLPDNWEVEDSDELAHYGVKGMKWGVRKNRKTSGSTNRKRTARKAKRKKKVSTAPKKDLSTRLIDGGRKALVAYFQFRFADFISGGALSRGVRTLSAVAGSFLNSRLQDFYDTHPRYEVPITDYRVD